MVGTAELDREIGRALRALATDTGFSVFERSLIWSEGDLVAEVRLFGRMETQLRAKPMVWDAALWSVLQLDDHVGRRVTRHWKSNACPVPVLDRRAISGHDPAHLADATMAHALEFKGQLERRIPQDFPVMMEGRVGGEQEWHFVMTELIWLVSSGKDEEARALCEDVLSGRRDSRFSMNSKDRLVTDSEGQQPMRSVFEHALLWLARAKQARTKAELR